MRAAEESDYLVEFLRERGFHEMSKARHEYLSYYGFDQEYAFVLVRDVVKASVTLREGTRFNISYIKGPNPVSLLRDEVGSRTKSPYSVRVESPEAVYMAVPRVRLLGSLGCMAGLLRTSTVHGVECNAKTLQR